VPKKINSKRYELVNNKLCHINCSGPFFLRNTNYVSMRIKPNAQRETELNSTQLNSSVQFSFPLCIEPATTCDDWRRPSPFLDCEEPALTTDNDFYRTSAY